LNFRFVLRNSICMMKILLTFIQVTILLFLFMPIKSNLFFIEMITKKTVD